MLICQVDRLKNLKETEKNLLDYCEPFDQTEYLKPKYRNEARKDPRWRATHLRFHPELWKLPETKCKLK
jgi:hypothetical protein